MNPAPTRSGPRSPAATRSSAAAPTPGTLQHGFYASAFHSGELADLEAVLSDGLRDEIAMLRLATRRVIACLDEFASPKEAVATLGALGLAATRLSTLLRTQKLLDGQEHSTAAALSQALSEVVRELGIHE